MWQYYSRSKDVWVAFDNEVGAALDLLPEGVLLYEHTIGESKYTFDFRLKTQTNQTSGYQRPFRYQEVLDLSGEPRSPRRSGRQ
jgi:hypothetical protein